MGRKRNPTLPDLDRFLEGRGRKFVTYMEGSDLYGIPYYSFVRLTKEAGANITLRKSAIVDVDVIVVEVKAGKGSDAGWGRLKSDAGWIALDYCQRV